MVDSLTAQQAEAIIKWKFAGTPAAALTVRSVEYVANVHLYRVGFTDGLHGFLLPEEVVADYDAMFSERPADVDAKGRMEADCGDPGCTVCAKDDSTVDVAYSPCVFLGKDGMYQLDATGKATKLPVTGTEIMARNNAQADALERLARMSPAEATGWLRILIAEHCKVVRALLDSRMLAATEPATPTEAPATIADDEAFHALLRCRRESIQETLAALRREGYVLVREKASE